MLTFLSDCQQNWLFSFDIKSGYHHIEIFQDDQQFFGFSWMLKGVIKYFKFTVLPFGLATGPYIFTKVMRPLVKHWRIKAKKNCGVFRWYESCHHVCNSLTELSLI